MISFLSKIIKLDSLHVVSVIKKEDDESYHVITVKRNGNKINIVATHTFKILGELVRNLDLKMPVVLVVNGKGILNKEINLNNEADVAWQKNIDFSTIYYTSFKSQNSSFMSFCRKNIVEETIVKFQKNGFQVIDIYIGSFLSALLQSSIKKQSLVSGDLLLEFDNENLSSFSKMNEIKNENYIIGVDTISSETLPLYGSLIHFFIKQKEVSKTENTSLNVEEIIYKKAFHFFGMTMIVGFFVSLLFSYFLIQYYGSKNNELNMKNVYSNKSYQKIVELEKQKENKLNILRESGFMSSKFLSFYGYEIMKNIPYDLSLNELNIIPADKEVKAEKEVKFISKTIVVKGETFNENAISSWLESLKKMEWLDSFEIISLKKDKKDKSQFEIKITLKNV
jgi:hypothetical protein